MSSASPPQPGSVLRSIQMLRAVAAWLVVVHHFDQLVLGFDSGTWTGRVLAGAGSFAVEIFFVISGFIMHASLKGGAPSARRFAVRRIERIVPVYWLATAVFVLASAAFLPAGSAYGAWNPGTFFKSLLFIPHDHAGGIGRFPVLTVGWSLNFEMFFYAALTAAIVVFRQRWMWPTVGLMFLLPVAVRLSGMPAGSLLGSRLLWLFAAGVVVGELWSRRQPPGKQAWAVFHLLAVVAACVAYLAGSLAPHGSTVDLALKMLLVTLLVWTALQCESSLPRSRWARLGVSLGDSSYSTYLVHPIILIVMIGVWPGRPEGTRAIALFALYVVATLLLSGLTSRYVERRRWFTAWRPSSLQKT